MIGSRDTSPLFGTEILGAGDNFWPPLFNDGSKRENNNVGTKSPVLNTHVAPPMSRYGSSSGQSSSRGSRKTTHASANGVSAKRRDKPLPAITIEDPTDMVAVKRARNTMAARKSRQKRVERNEELETRIAQLEKEADYWKRRAFQLGHVEQ